MGNESFSHLSPLIVIWGVLGELHSSQIPNFIRFQVILGKFRPHFGPSFYPRKPIMKMAKNYGVM